MAEPLDQAMRNLTEVIKTLNYKRFERLEPRFFPNRDTNDYHLYTKFKEDFAYFMKDLEVNNWEDKIRWLFHCLGLDAYNLVCHVTLDEAGYNEAFRKLDKSYLCTSKIRYEIFQYIYSFSILDFGKNNSNLGNKLVELNNYICQLIKHHGFEMNSSLSKFIGYIIMKDLPNEV